MISGYTSRARASPTATAKSSAISLPTAALYANPREMIDAADTAHKLKAALPDLDEAAVQARLQSDKQFVYLARELSPRQELKINDLGIPGIYFEPTERRHYPLGRVAAQVLGGVDVDGHGVAGVERFFDKRLHDDPTPLALSLDVRVQAVMRDELAKAMDEFQAIGACGIVMDVRTGEVLAMVSLPDYDANDVGHASADERFNRAVTGMYEPGSTFKLQTASVALDSGTVHIWDEFDAVSRSTSAASPSPTSRASTAGSICRRCSPIRRTSAPPTWPTRSAANASARGCRTWACSAASASSCRRPALPLCAGGGELEGDCHDDDRLRPRHRRLAAARGRGTAAVANGGILVRPTILAHDPDAPPRDGCAGDADIHLGHHAQADAAGGHRRLSARRPRSPAITSAARPARRRRSAHTGYEKHANVSAFTSVFPMNAPRYAVYMMLDEPHGNKSTLRLLHRRLGDRAVGREGDRAHRRR